MNFATRGACSVIDTTEDHPFWNATDKQWQPADALEPGDQLATNDGRKIDVTGIRPNSARHDRAYNLTVYDFHTYYVLAGQTPVLVHNCNTPPALRGEFNKMRPGIWKNEAQQNPGLYSPEGLERMKAGKAPIGDDGFPMEVHHRIPLSKGGTNDPSNFMLLTRTQHRLGENYRLNHPPCDCG